MRTLVCLGLLLCMVVNFAAGFRFGQLSENRTCFSDAVLVGIGYSEGEERKYYVYVEGAFGRICCRVPQKTYDEVLPWLGSRVVIVSDGEFAVLWRIE